MLGTIAIVVAGVVLLTLLGLWLVGERGRLLLPSSWKVMKGVGPRRLFSLKYLHGYIYGRWNRQYINLLLNYINPRLGPRGRKWITDRYHGKVLTHDEAKAIVTINKKIPLRDLEQVIPYPMARNIVLEGPPDVTVIECSCRHARSSPCQPTRVCMAIGQPFADFMLEHHPQTSRRLGQAEALELLNEERKRGHMHSAWFKDACEDRFFAICNCCKCCCGGIEAMKIYGAPFLAPSGYVARVDKSFCTACGACVKACPFDAISLKGEGIALDWSKCMGCGVCTSVCPNHARSLVRDEGKGLPLDVRLLA